ncbi:aldehyde dehydrogenase [Variovorax sp. KK3]|uniref:aldehyde dehydrogenase n=1 Tax=Variovorax sp. KK3 TaxID=1855728 RepID=UPI00097BCC8F|nr:aldehyde dehydrogenase [Variovorax sp. KK3]
MQDYPMYIGGESMAAAAGRWMDSENPFSGEVWARVARGDAQDASRAVEVAHQAFAEGPWRDLTPSARGLLLHKLGDLILRDARKLAEAEVRDSGRLIADMVPQVTYLAQAFHYFGGLCDKIEGAVIPLDRKGYFNFTRHEPVGVVAALTPWNAPLLVTCMMIAPALCAGCTVVLKPSEFSSVSTLAFAKLFEEAGFPPGVVNVVTGYGAEVGAALVAHPRVRAIAFTGSDATGRHLAQQAARDFKRVVLELGGKSPNIVFDDADLDAAANGAATAILNVSGQSCVAGTRLLVQESVYDRFMDKLLSVARMPRMGDPMDASTSLGPLSTRPQYDKVLGYIDTARAEGAKLLLGGSAATRPECGKGWFIEPTVFEVRNDMRIAQEEVFGPVLSVIRFRDEAHALAIANDVRFGLAAGVWTQDFARAMRMAETLQAGSVWINCYRQVSFLSPFGGYKDSGMGRENGPDAVKEYLQVKSVWMNTGAPVPNPYAPR